MQFNQKDIIRDTQVKRADLAESLDGSIVLHYNDTELEVPADDFKDFYGYYNFVFEPENQDVLPYRWENIAEVEEYSFDEDLNKHVIEKDKPAILELPYLLQNDNYFTIYAKIQGGKSDQKVTLIDSAGNEFVIADGVGRIWDGKDKEYTIYADDVQFKGTPKFYLKFETKNEPYAIESIGAKTYTFID